MRIAFFAITLGIESKGGEFYIHQLANSLVGRGHDVLVIQAGKPLPDAKYRSIFLPLPFRLAHRVLQNGGLSLQGVQNRVQRRANRLLHHIFLQATVPILLPFRPQVLIPLFSRPELWYARVFQKLLECALLMVGHGPAINDALAIEHVDAFVATSPRQASWASYFEGAKVELIPIGVDTKRFTVEGSKACLSLTPPIFLQVGSLLPVKRAHLSIEAIHTLGYGSLLLIGNGPLANSLDSMGKAKLGNERYQRISRVPHAKLSQYYRLADVLVFPSDTGETAGLVLLEALACGTPVIASNDETRQWLVGEIAQLIDPEDKESFADALKIVCASETRQPQRLAQFAKKFSWEMIAAHYEELCTDTLARLASIRR